MNFPVTNNIAISFTSFQTINNDETCIHAACIDDKQQQVATILSKFQVGKFAKKASFGLTGWPVCIFVDGNYLLTGETGPFSVEMSHFEAIRI